MLREDTMPGPGRRHSVLVVDDDRVTNQLLTRAMLEAGHEVRRAFSGPEALRAVDVRPPDLVLLEVDLPGLDGLDVLEGLRRPHAPVFGVIVVSRRAAEHHRLAGFAAGADDYVVKPFSPGEVSARAATILRRLGGRSHLSPSAPLVGGPLQVEPAARRVTCDGRNVDLTRLEYRLLLDLVSRPGVVRTRDQLIDAAWGAELRADANTVTVHIQRMRRKLLVAGCPTGLVQTVRGLGYRFDASLSGVAR